MTGWCCTSRSPSTSISPRSTAGRSRLPIWPRTARWACGRCGRPPRSSRTRSRCSITASASLGAGRQDRRCSHRGAARAVRRARQRAGKDRLDRRRALHGGRHQHGRGRPLRQAAPELFDAAPRSRPGSPPARRAPPSRRCGTRATRSRPDFSSPRSCVCRIHIFELIRPGSSPPRSGGEEGTDCEARVGDVVLT